MSIKKSFSVMAIAYIIIKLILIVVAAIASGAIWVAVGTIAILVLIAKSILAK